MCHFGNFVLGGRLVKAMDEKEHGLSPLPIKWDQRILWKEPESIDDIEEL